MNSSSSVLEYINELLVKLHHSLITDEIDNLCVVLNLLYRVKYDKPFLLTENNGFISDNLENENDPVLCPLHDYFKREDIFFLIFNTYQELRLIDHDKYLEVYADAVENAIFRHLSRLKRISIPSFELTRLVCSLIARNGIKSVYNPFAQIASYILGLNDIEYYGQDINPIIRMIGRIRMDAHHRDASKYFLGDAISQWDDHGAECLVCTPPYGYIDHIPELKRKDYTEFVIESFLKSNSTYAYIITTPGFCFNARSQDLRAFITEKNYLDLVISLPQNLFSNTGLGYHLIILNKKKETHNTLFVNASDLSARKNGKAILETDLLLDIIAFRPCDDERIIIVEESLIRDNYYQWNPHSYIRLSEDQIPQGFVPRRLGEVVQFIPRRKDLSNKSGYVASVKDLNNDGYNFEREIDSFKTTDKLNLYYYIKEPVILVSSYGKLKPTYCKASLETPLYINADILAFRITNPWIDPSYLCMVLSKSDPARGLSSTRFDVRLLELTEIALPILSPQGLEEQQQIYQEAADAYNRSKIKELGLEKTIEKMKTDYINEVRMRKHDMKTPMTQLRMTLKLFETLADKAPQDVAEKMSIYIKRQKIALNNLSEIVGHLADEDHFAIPEPVDIDTILSEAVAEGANYVVTYQRDEKAFDLAEIDRPLVNIGKTDFIRLVQNIVGNAIKHGFIEKQEKYSLNINLTIDNQFYVIEFVNNGVPLPEGMDSERYGMKGVKSKDSDGSGIGGYIVRSICQHYKGDYEIFSHDEAGEILTSVIVKLPIYLDYEQI